MKLSFLWWNTSLSPVGKDRSSEGQKLYAMSMINIFTQELKADLIALGEVKDTNISLIRDQCDLQGYELYDGYTKAGRSHFDTCILYRAEKLRLFDNLNITAGKGGRTFKIAQRLDFAISEHDIPLHIFVSHWPSRLRMQQNHSDRHFLGLKLRVCIEELLEIYQEKMTLVLLGDYNDEPFDISLAEHLMASRDRALVRNRSHLLYNPFWRKIGHESPYTHEVDELILDAGTYFYRSDPSSRWRTFDQIIFSSNFLGNSEWHLNEKLTQVLNIPAYRELVLDPKEIFDHLPVMSVIEKVA